MPPSLSHARSKLLRVASLRRTNDLRSLRSLVVGSKLTRKLKQKPLQRGAFVLVHLAGLLRIPSSLTRCKHLRELLIIEP